MLAQTMAASLIAVLSTHIVSRVTPLSMVHLHLIRYWTWNYSAKHEVASPSWWL